MSFGTVARGLQPHRGAVAAVRQLALERAAQVVDFFLVDEQVAVAGHAELVAAHHLDAGEQLRARRPARCVDSSTKPRGWPAPRRAAARRAAASAAPARWRARCRGRRHPCPSRRTMKFRLLFWMRGNGRAGSRPSGLRDRLDLVREILLQPRVASCGVQSERACTAHAGVRQRRQQHLVEAAVLVGAPGAARARGCRRAARGSTCASGASWVLPSSCRCFRPATRISKNSSRLPEEMHRNFSRSSSGTRVIEGLRQHPLIELQQGEFAVDVAARRLEIGGVHGITIHKRPRPD